MRRTGVGHEGEYLFTLVQIDAAFELFVRVVSIVFQQVLPRNLTRLLQHEPPLPPFLDNEIIIRREGNVSACYVVAVLRRR